MQDKQIKGNIVFKETQRFSQTWFWLLLISPIVMSIGITILALSTDDKKEAWFVVPFVLILNLCILYGFYITRLELIVTDWAVYYRWRPFSRKYRQVSRYDIKEARIRKSPFLQIGSKRMVFGYGHVQHTGTKEGVQFVLHSGKKIFIGSEKVKGFYRAVEALVPDPS
ncbi:MAG: hypothetical protein SFU20_00360 [Chitinophagaceae bacterium]|nr:hypothetical protein [Chitinophagaceae bacterium]